MTFKRFTLSLTLLAMVVLCLPLASAQVDTDDLTTLANEFPTEEAVLFASIRTDDAFIQQLDGLFAPFYPYADDLPPDFTLQMGLDLALEEAEIDGTFDEVIRPWLGDTVGLAAFVNPAAFEGDTTFLSVETVFDDLLPAIAVQITDKDEAIAFLEMLMEAEGETADITERGDYTVYVVDDVVIAFSDDTALLYPADEFETDLLSGDFATIADDAIFDTTLASMPQDAYNALIYANTPVILSVFERVAAEPEAFGAEEAQETIAFFEQFGFGGVAGGAVILEGDTFTIDTVIVDAADYLSAADLGTIDPAFAGLIPATTPFVIHGTNLAASYQAALDVVEQLGDDTDVEELNEGLAEVDQVLQAQVGLNLEDIVGWMSNDYALTLSLSDTALNSSSIFGLIGANPAELGVLIDASADPAAAVAVVDAVEELLDGPLLGAALQQTEEPIVDVSLEREGDVLTATVSDETGQVPFPVELRVGVEDDVFYIGTPGLANAVTAGDGGLASTDALQDALGVFLPEPYSAYFISVDNLTPLVGIAESFADEEDMDDIETAAELLSLFRHLTISQAVDAENNALVRATITLSDE